MDDDRNPNILTGADVKKKALKSFKWAALGEISSRSIQPIITLILARLLIPADFGLVGIGMVAIGLAQILQDFGLGKALIQRDSDIEKSANIVFWTNMGLSIAIYFSIFISAPAIASFFHIPHAVIVFRVLCFQVVLSGLTAVPQALLQRKFNFYGLFFSRLLGGFVPGMISIPLAFSGHGVWALVFGVLAGSAAQILYFFCFHYWRPQFNFDVHLAGQLFGFSSWVALDAFLAWFILWGDSIALGHYLGVAELGVYRVGSTFLLLVFGTFFNPILPIAYSAFSRLQNNRDRLVTFFLKLTKLIAVIAIPLGTGLVILADRFTSVIFGPRWPGVEIVLVFIGAMYAMGWLVGINPELYRAMGRPDINSKLSVVAVIYYLPVYLIAAPHGLAIFCMARLLVAVLAMGMHIFVANKVLGLKPTYLGPCIKKPLLGSFIMGVTVYAALRMVTFIDRRWGDDWIGLCCLMLFCATIYMLVMRVLDRDMVAQFRGLVREVLR